MLPNKPGPQTELDDELIAKIIDAVPKVIILKHVAQLSKIPYTTLYTWLKRGNKEIKEGLTDTIYVKLSMEYYAKRSEVLQEKLERLNDCPKNYGAITWVLEKCFKEDFETKSEYMKQLEDYIFNYIKPMLAKGGFENGGKEAEEMDSESY